MAIYEVNFTGTTYLGDTTFVDPAVTGFSPLEDFVLDGRVIVDVPFDPSSFIDVGLQAGDPFDSAFFAGEIVWGSNQALHTEFGPQQPIDEVIQTASGDGWVVSVLDPQVAPFTALDFFVDFSGPEFETYNIVSGEVDIFISADGTEVFGNAALFGQSAFGTAAWEASFSGVSVI